MQKKQLSFFLVILFFVSGCDKQVYKKSVVQKQNNLMLLPPPPDLLRVSKKQMVQEETKQQSQKNTMAINQSNQSVSNNVDMSQSQRGTIIDPQVDSVADDQKSNVAIEALRVKSPQENEMPRINEQDQLTVRCSNKSNKPLIFCCFYYTKLRQNAYWRWMKSPIYFLENNDECTIPIFAMDDLLVKQEIMGYLGVFHNKEEAEAATFESLREEQKIDLDYLLELRNSSIEIIINRYGFKKEQIDYRRKADKQEHVVQPELDFMIENKTGKPLLACCFVYQKNSDQDNLMPWRYHKTKIQKIMPHESMLVDIDTIKDLYDWIYMRGFLALFEADQVVAAEEATYELLKPEQKINLGRLADVLGKKILISVEKYGSAKKIFEFQQVEASRIDFKQFDKRRKSRSIL